jgi:hypothetical protein
MFAETVYIPVLMSSRFKFSSWIFVFNFLRYMLLKSETRKVKNFQLIRGCKWIYSVFSAQADWTLTHTSQKDTEHNRNFYHTRWRNTDWHADQVTTEWIIFSLPGDTSVCRYDVLDV